MLIGKQVSLQDMLLCRERRAAYQQQFISEHNCPIISFCLNIPGPVKTTLDLRNAFAVGKTEITNLLHTSHLAIIDAVEFHDDTGDELILCIDGDATTIKKQTSLIEDQHALGRLFDIDVIDIDGTKLSRDTYRKCFICNCQAQVCASSRKHTVLEMQQAIEQILSLYL